MGITYVSPERESIDKIIRVCNNFGVEYTLIDPLDLDTAGINPFENKDPYKAASSISEILYLLTNSTKKTVDLPEFTFENVRAIQNIAILLKETYPDSHTGQLPTIEDIMKLLANFKLLEALVEKYRKHLETENKFPGLIEYFENNFFEKGQNRRNMKKQMEAPLAIIDSVLKNQGVRIL